MASSCNENGAQDSGLSLDDGIQVLTSKHGVVVSAHLNNGAAKVDDMEISLAMAGTNVADEVSTLARDNSSALLPSTNGTFSQASFGDIGHNFNGINMEQHVGHSSSSFPLSCNGENMVMREIRDTRLGGDVEGCLDNASRKENGYYFEKSKCNDSPISNLNVSLNGYDLPYHANTNLACGYMAGPKFGRCDNDNYCDAVIRPIKNGRSDCDLNLVSLNKEGNHGGDVNRCDLFSKLDGKLNSYNLDKASDNDEFPPLIGNGNVSHATMYRPNIYGKESDLHATSMVNPNANMESAFNGFYSLPTLISNPCNKEGANLSRVADLAQSKPMSKVACGFNLKCGADVACCNYLKKGVAMENMTMPRDDVASNVPLKRGADLASLNKYDVAGGVLKGDDMAIIARSTDDMANRHDMIGSQGSQRDGVFGRVRSRADVVSSVNADVAKFKFDERTPYTLGGNVSYAHVLNGSKDDVSSSPTSITLQYFKPTVIDGRVKVSPPLEVAEEGSMAWRNTLVGYFIGKKLPFKVVDSIAHKLWGKQGLREVLSSDNGFFFFKFANFQDACVVMERAPWHMANRPLVLKHWQPGLPLAKEDAYRVPVWVRLYNVPFEYWTSKGLSFVASAVGCPLHADHITLSRRRLSYARVCVEIDAKADLIDDFDFQCSNGRWINIRAEFEWVPMKCASCDVFGHSLSTCPKVASKNEEGKPSKVWVPKPPVSLQSEVTKKEEWVMVSRKNKGKTVLKEETLMQHEELILETQGQTDVAKGHPSHGMELVAYEPREEGECSPSVVQPICKKILTTREDVSNGVVSSFPSIDLPIGEIDMDGVEEEDSPIFNGSSLALKAKDSLEKKKPGPSNKNKKGSGGKKGRKHHSPRGGRWK